MHNPSAIKKKKKVSISSLPFLQHPYNHALLFIGELSKEVSTILLEWNIGHQEHSLRLY
jgi:hypothetical protein